jgi:hypothetical protein
MSGSSQRSYENPILESVQTILDLATKLEADDKRTLLGTTGRASMGREARRQCPCYEESLRRLKGQVEGYVAHPAVVYSGVHTSPMGIAPHTLSCFVFGKRISLTRTRTRSTMRQSEGSRPRPACGCRYGDSHFVFGPAR